MQKIKALQFVKALDFYEKKSRIYLFYGNDPQFIAYSFDHFITYLTHSSNLSLEVNRIDLAAFDHDIFLYLSAQNSLKNLFINQKIFLISNIKENNLKKVLEAHQKLSKIYLFFDLSHLNSFYKTVSSYQNIPNVLAISAYQLNLTEKKEYIQNCFKERNIEIEANLLDCLLSFLPTDFLLLNNELHKTFLYLGEKKSFVFEDLNLFTTITPNVHLDPLFMGILKGSKKALNEVQLILENQIEPHVLARIFLKFLMRLIDFNFNPNKQLSYNTTLYEDLLKYWTLKKINKEIILKALLEKTNIIEVLLRQSSNNPLYILQQFFIEVYTLNNHSNFA